MSVLHIDFETRSVCDLRKAGADRYAADPTTDLWCMAWAFDQDDVALWQPGDPLPLRVIAHVQSGGRVVAHNVHFELAIWNHVLEPRYGFPRLDPAQCDCTMTRGYSCSLPGRLEDVALAIKLPFTKDAKGKAVMLRMARPRKFAEDGSPIWWDNDAEKKAKLFSYCKQDVRVEQALDDKLPALIPSERELWEIDYRINQRGIGIDVPTVQRAMQIVRQWKKKLNAQLRTITDHRVESAQQVTEFRHWINSRGVRMFNLQKTTVENALAGKLPDDVRKALEIRQEGGRNSTAKLEAMLACVDDDGRARGLYTFLGAASTGRWAGRRAQPQNLLRPEGVFAKDFANVLRAIELINGPEPIKRLQEEFGSVGSAVGSCLRSMIKADDGNTLVAADFVAVEGRVLNWLADARGLEVYRANDRKEGPEPYCVAANAIFGLDNVHKDTHPRERLIGKVAELALGYQGASGAFASMAKNYGIEVDVRAGTVSGDIDIQGVVDNWREANPEIVRYWWKLENAAIAAIRNPDKTYAVGAVRFRMRGPHLACKLPSSRILLYPYAELVRRDDGRNGKKVTYYGQDTYTRQWGRTPTYGGKLAENITQAVARDLLANGIKNAEAHDYPIVMHSHDEGVAEIATGRADLKEFEGLMTELPEWASGLPLVAEGWVSERYRK